jgi:hypothetical protein
MSLDLLFIDLSVGLVIVEVPAYSPFINFSIGFWLVMLSINFVLGVLKRVPFF